MNRLNTIWKDLVSWFNDLPDGIKAIAYFGYVALTVLFFYYLGWYLITWVLCLMVSLAVCYGINNLLKGKAEKYYYMVGVVLSLCLVLYLSLYTTFVEWLGDFIKAFFMPTEADWNQIESPRLKPD